MEQDQKRGLVRRGGSKPDYDYYNHFVTPEKKGV
jgi:hypothetical protein